MTTLPESAKPAPARKRRGLGTLGKLLLLATSLAMAVFAAEVWFYLTRGRPTQTIARDPRLGWRYLANARYFHDEEGGGTVRINADGYRGGNWSEVKGPGIFRIGLFGDSMSIAQEVDIELSYPRLVEEGLNRERGDRKRFEVYNFSVHGYSPAQELLTLQEQGPRFRPDLSILAIFLDNDVSGSDRDLSVVAGAPWPLLDEGELGFDFRDAEREYDKFHLEPIHTLRRYSHLYRMFARARRGAGRGGGAGGGGGSAGIPVRFRLYLDPPDPKWEEPWRRMEAVVLEFVRQARTLPSRAIVLNVPAAQVVSETSWETLLAEHPGMRGRSWNLNGPNDRFRSFLTQNGIEWIDPDAAFRAAAKDEQLFFGNVGHMTPAGHRVMTRAILDYFQAHPVDAAPAARD